MSLALRSGDIVPPARGRYQGYFHVGVRGLLSKLGSKGGTLAGQGEQSTSARTAGAGSSTVNVPIGVWLPLRRDLPAAPPGQAVERQDRLHRRRTAHDRHRAAPLVAEKGREWGWGSTLWDPGMILVAVAALVAFAVGRRMEAIPSPLRISPAAYQHR
jgi:hypothetical protein